MKTLVHGRHHHTSEHAAYLTDGSKDGSSFRNFRRLIPRPENVYRTAVEA